MTRFITHRDQLEIDAHAERLQLDDQGRAYQAGENCRCDALSICLKWTLSGLALCILFVGVTA